MDRKKNKRRQFVVESDFQFGFIRKLAILSLFIILFSFSLLGLAYHFYGDVRVEVEVCQPMPFGLASGTMVVDSLQTGPVCSFFDLLWPVVLISVILTLALASLFGLFFSHKMVGPVHRMRRDLAGIRQGDFGMAIKIRNGDAFQPMVSDINRLREHWRVLIKELRGIYHVLDSEDPDAHQRSLARLGEILSSFRTGPEDPGKK